MSRIAVKESDWLTLEEFAGYQFSAEEREAITHELDVCRDYRDYLADTVTRQDVKRTLLAISKMNPAEAVVAWEKCDQITDMLIYEAAYFQIGVQLFGLDGIEQGEAIVKAADIALNAMPGSSGGRPAKSHHDRLAEFTCDLWEKCGNKHAATTWDGQPSAMVEFAALLFDLVDDKTTDLSTIASRLNQAR